MPVGRKRLGGGEVGEGKEVGLGNRGGGLVKGRGGLAESSVEDL